MTGFGSGSAELPEGRLLARLRAVNHRFLDLRVRLPEELMALAPLAERALRLLHRGRLELRVDLEGAVSQGLEFREERAREALAQLRRLRDAVAPEEPLPWSLLSAVPGLFESSGTSLEPRRCESALRLALEEATAQLDAMRRAEGEVLRTDLSERLARVERCTERLATEAPRVAERLAERLRERVARLLPENVPVDPARLEHEVALLAERADVAEELTRLRSHAAQFRTLLEHPGEGPVGRRLDFLLQEMLREANTAGVKCAEAAMQHVAIDLKAELERMREQVQNVL